MLNAQTIAIVAALVVGIAIAASLFTFYSDVMLEGTSFDTASAGSDFSQPYMDETGPAPGGTPQEIVP